VALTEEAAGHPDKADAVLNTGGTFVDCYRFRGDILDGRGDWKDAQEWYSKSVALAPDLPAGYYSWGLALAKHGDGAATKLKDANHRGPHWADPLKAWGDVLARQGKSKQAATKYEEALKYAPN
jgi:tetratricopeptide (TPR) repeat protein